jgi:hypothetical protein
MPFLLRAARTLDHRDKSVKAEEQLPAPEQGKLNLYRSDSPLRGATWLRE